MLAIQDVRPAESAPGPTYVLDFGANLACLPEITGSAPSAVTGGGLEHAAGDGLVGRHERASAEAELGNDSASSADRPIDTFVVAVKTTHQEIETF